MKKKIEKRYTPIKWNFDNAIIRTIILIAMVVVAQSCNFDFPEESQEAIFSTDDKFHFDTGTHGGILELGLEGLNNEPFQVVVYPQWMDIKTFEGKLQNGYCSIPFDFVNISRFLSAGRAEGHFYIKLGSAGIFQIRISYGEKTNDDIPEDERVPLHCNVAEIDFGLENSINFTLTNNGKQENSWYAEHIPSWLKLSKTEGVISGGQNESITCTVNRDGLNPGEYSQIIDIESFNPQLSHGILIKMTVDKGGNPVNSAQLKWIDGKVKDAWYSKNSDLLYILTESPNALLVKSSGIDSLVSYELERVPNCIDVSTDEKTIAIGYNQAYIDIWDAKTMEREKLIETDCVPFDIALGQNGWCYLAPDEDQWVHFYSLNLETGVTYRSSSSVAIYEKSVLLKMPDKPLIYITRPQLSPTGLLIANIENGVANDTLASWHESIGSKFWFTKDGSKLLGANKEIYKTPDYTTSSTNGISLPKFGKIDIPRNQIQSLDYNENLTSFYVVGSDYHWAAYNAETIYQVDEISFSALKSFKVGTYPGRINNRSDVSMDVHFVYTNKEGTKLYAIKNVEHNLDMNLWAIETFNLSEIE